MLPLETMQSRDIEVIGSRVEMLKPLWDESERRLAILRTQSGDELQPATDEMILKWGQRVDQPRTK